ncbi:GPP34 family phosphoprotein [Actinoplanes sp. NPDC049681]|uniref:GOLPH3/VPS74 family protein n=1 Tax=Actinoplanes sp. NPDC049681 TaxID=3363905 RepID=UPI003794A2AD
MMTVRQLTSMREQLWLLAHDHRDLRPLIEVRALAIGLAAAVLTDLMLHRWLTIQDGKIYVEGGTEAADDPITADILAALDVTPAASLQDVLHAARPDLPEDPRNPFQRLHERTVAAMVAADILVAQRRTFRSARYELVDPSLASWTRGQFNRRLVYSDGPADDLNTDILCALTWALNLHHKLLMPFNATEAGPILLTITDHVPKRAGKRSALTVMPYLARTVRHTIGELATAAF